MLSTEPEPSFDHKIPQQGRPALARLAEMLARCRAAQQPRHPAPAKSRAPAPPANLPRDDHSTS